MISVLPWGLLVIAILISVIVYKFNQNKIDNLNTKVKELKKRSEFLTQELKKQETVIQVFKEHTSDVQGILAGHHELQKEVENAKSFKEISSVLGTDLSDFNSR